MLVDAQTWVLLMVLPQIVLFSLIGFKICYEMHIEEQALLSKHKKRCIRERSGS
jgi:hypothetical protein